MWVADGVVFCSGSRIDNGVILGTGAVVRGEILGFAVADGNPI